MNETLISQIKVSMLEMPDHTKEKSQITRAWFVAGETQQTLKCLYNSFHGDGVCPASAVT